MNNEMLLELGRVVYVNYGPMSGKAAVVVDIIDGSKVVIDGPGLGIQRQAITTKRLELTKFRVGSFSKGDKRSALQKKIEEFGVQKRFDSCGVGKRIVKQKRRAQLGDFDRFQAMVLRRRLSKAVRTHVNKNRKAIIAKSQ
jgi:large subunit ribosomal protein L14e